MSLLKKSATVYMADVNITTVLINRFISGKIYFPWNKSAVDDFFQNLNGTFIILDLGTTVNKGIFVHKNIVVI